MVFLFDVVDGNPNGDPDAGNRPRMDDESGQGLVTDVALNRKLRDTITLAAAGMPRYEIFVQAGYALNPRLEESYSTQGLTLDKNKTKITAARQRPLAVGFAIATSTSACSEPSCPLVRLTHLDRSAAPYK
jgi:CRISPR-associated protein Csd2